MDGVNKIYGYKCYSVMLEKSKSELNNLYESMNTFYNEKKKTRGVLYINLDTCHVENYFERTLCYVENYFQWCRGFIKCKKFFSLP